jgi:hypothetical protein
MAGALDEREPLIPHVLLPNYMYSPSNCLGTTSFFDVCCPNECDLILEHLEQGLQAPDASPEQVSTLLASLPSNIGMPSESLSPLALKQLDAVAQSDGGRVSIHGHTFAGWLHASFPRECPRVRAQDFTPSKSGEVPGTEKEYQDVADATSELDMAATEEELLLEVEALELMERTMNQNETFKAINTNETFKATSEVRDAFPTGEQLLGLAGGTGFNGGFDGVSFAQTDAQTSVRNVEQKIPADEPA